MHNYIINPNLFYTPQVITYKKNEKSVNNGYNFFLISLNKHTGILLHFTYYWDSLKLCYIKSHIKIHSLWPSTISLRKKWNDYSCWVVVLGVWHPFWTVCSKGSYEDTPEAKGHENDVNCFVSCFIRTCIFK